MNYRRSGRTVKYSTSKFRNSGRAGHWAAAVDEVGEVYTKLLELSTTADLIDVPTDDVSAAAQLNDSLDAIRAAFAELETDAITTRALL